MDIRNLRRIDNNGVTASGYVTIPATVTDVAILQGKEGNIFYDLPNHSYKDEEGNWHKAYYAQPIDKDGSAAVLTQVRSAVEKGEYRKVTSEKNPALLGFMSVTGIFSVKVCYTDKGRVFTDFRTYQKDGVTKYHHYVQLSKEQATAIIEAFKTALE